MRTTACKFEDPERLAKTLVIELDGQVIGDLMLAIEDAWAQSEVATQAQGVQAELGWCLDPAHQGRGYATEAVAALMRLCFEDLGLRRVTANCFADNEQSWRLMERLGMRREVHTLRESLHRSGEWLDGMGYALLADEWRDEAAKSGRRAAAATAGRPRRVPRTTRRREPGRSRLRWADGRHAAASPRGRTPSRCVTSSSG